MGKTRMPDEILEQMQECEKLSETDFEAAHVKADEVLLDAIMSSVRWQWTISDVLKLKEAFRKVRKQYS